MQSVQRGKRELYTPIRIDENPVRYTAISWKLEMNQEGIWFLYEWSRRTREWLMLCTHVNAQDPWKDAFK